jgi:hypothetical protein
VLPSTLKRPGIPRLTTTHHLSKTLRSFNYHRKEAFLFPRHGRVTLLGEFSHVGRVTRFVGEKIAQNVAQLIFAQNYCKTFAVENWPSIFKNSPKQTVTQ